MLQIWGMVSALYKLHKGKVLEIPYFKYTGLHAGFESPARDYLQKRIDLNEILIKNPDSTFFADVEGDCMIEAGVADPSRLIVDKALTPNHNDIVVISIDGSFTVRKYQKKRGVISLIHCNKKLTDLKPIYPDQDATVFLWGVVTQILVDPKAVMYRDSVG